MCNCTSGFDAFASLRSDGRELMLRDAAVGDVENRFRERKLQHDPALVVGHFDGRIQERAVGTFDLQEFLDHGARHLPGAVGIPEHLAIGIGNQLVADTGVEEIAWHRRKPTQVEASQPAGPYEFSHVSLSGTGGAPSHEKSPFPARRTTANGLIPRCFDREHPHKTVTSYR